MYNHTFIDTIPYDHLHIEKAINEDKILTARAVNGNEIKNKHGNNEATYNFTKVYDMTESTMDLFETAMKPLMDFKFCTAQYTFTQIVHDNIIYTEY